MKKIGILAVAMAVAFLLVGVASAEMYVEGYLGGAFTQNIGQTIGVRDVNPINGTAQNLTRLNYGGVVDPTVIGGVKVGTWFVPEGTLGWSGYPSCLKYFGFYTDFSYQRLFTRDNRVGGSQYFGFNNSGPARTSDVAGFMKTEGMAATWAFMFSARYGFFADSEVPFGRLQPYVAVGPAIMFTSMKPKIWTQIFTPPGAGGTDLNMSPGTKSATNIALAADAGIRYMMLKNVSADISFRYRYAQPTYTFSGQDGNFGVPATFKMNTPLNLFSLQAGVAYHF